MRHAGSVVANDAAHASSRSCGPGLVVKELDKIVRKEFEKQKRAADVPRLPRLPGDRLRLRQRRDRARHPRQARDPGRRRRQPRPRLHLQGLRRRLGADGHRRQRRSRGTEKLVDVTRECAGRGHPPRARRQPARRDLARHPDVHRSRTASASCASTSATASAARCTRSRRCRTTARDRGPVLKKGMVLALEPMVTMGDWRTKQMDDNWTVKTIDGSLAAHFEHTIAITDGRAAGPDRPMTA